MIVRSVDVHEPLADVGQHGQARGRAIDELPVGPGAGKRAFEDELVVLTGLDSIGIEQIRQRRRHAPELEHRFHDAGITAVAEQRAVGSLAQDQTQGADENRLAGAGFAGNGIVARLQFEGQILDQGQVFDTQGREHLSAAA